ncbi:MAG: response regulator transcription factor [Vallitaleaceae bacterium]|nr:response regulator transcription factor [Vallitaleaceae bacterium]
MISTRILVVEDEEKLRTIIKKYLTNEGYRVYEAANGQEALDLFEVEEVDLIILDVMMPVMDGWMTLKLLRKKSKIPVMMLTARTDEEDTVFGLELGADDYVAKPFRARELVARVKSLLHRSGKIASQDKIDIGQIHIDTAAMRVDVSSDEVVLSPKEYELLLYFINNANQALSREQILTRIWGYDFEGDDRTVDTVVKRLRKKLGEEGERINTIRGIGYRFEVER